MTALQAFLRRHEKIALDTSVFVYYLEANPRYVELAYQVLTWVQTAGHSAVTSTVTMTELLVKPIRTLKESGVVRMYDLLLDYPNLFWLPVDLAIAKEAAAIRAVYNLRTPDALHAATAVREGATGFVTNDASFERVPAFETLLFDRLL